MKGSIVKRKSGTYAIVYRVGGRQRWETVGPRKKDAEKVLTERLAAIHAGTFRDLRPILFQDWAEKWLKDWAAPRVKGGTHRIYESAVRVHFVPAFGDLALHQIGRDTVQHFIARTVEAGDLNAVTLSNLVTLLSTVLKDAVDAGHLRENPIRGIRRPKRPHKEMAVLTPEEIRRLLDHAPPGWYATLLTAVMTGVRRGELFALKWGDIDWEEGQLHVRRALYVDWKMNGQGRPKLSFVSPKSKSGSRTVDLSPVLLDILRKYRAGSPHNGMEDLLFAEPDGSPMVPDTAVKRGFLPALKAAGLRHVRFHDLRHTYVALLIAGGEGPKYIQSQVGHASIQMTFDRYGHLFPGRNRPAMERLDEQVFGEARRPALVADERVLDEEKPVAAGAKKRLDIPGNFS